MRMVLALVLGTLIAGPALAQPEERPWEATVTGQIEALRSGDAAGALNLAGAAFQENYEDPERFVSDVERSGYGPIIGSRSYSLGTFREIGPDTVAQAVNLVGPDGRLYEAVYQLVNEPETGWRVHGVVMRRVDGLNT